MADDAGRLNEIFAETSFLYGANAAFVEDLYATYLANPNGVDAGWRAFFDGMRDRTATTPTVGKPGWYKPLPEQNRTEVLSALDGIWPVLEKKIGAALSAKGTPPVDLKAATLDSLRALMMIRAYRVRGHLAANLDPLGLDEKKPHPELDPATYGFGPDDMGKTVYLDHVMGLETATIAEVLSILRTTYCGTLGVEFMHISDPEQKSWIQNRAEQKTPAFSPDQKRAILRDIVKAETFERFIHKRFPGTKRFGLDGAEAMIPAMEEIITTGATSGVKDIVIGMPHRGRLNVLAAILGKPYQVIFCEFQGGSSSPHDVDGSGDVKYHLGASSDRVIEGHKVHLSLTANPSHLEAVDPVVLGKARAKQTDYQRIDPNTPRTASMPVLLHGDAAFAGQGIVAECFALSGLKGYRTGGAMHLIVNNQIGFTTSPSYSRSSPYPSDVAKTVQAPIFHVNGDDVEAVIIAAKVATEFRQTFGQDVVIDLFCYRRYGHNEGDDPSFTQPLMYRKIKDQPTTREIYTAKLVAEGVVTMAEVEAQIAAFETFLDQEFDAGKGYEAKKADWLDGAWTGFEAANGDRIGQTGVDLKTLKTLGTAITTIPASVDCHKTLKRVIEGRAKAVADGAGIDWALGEHLAFATLLAEGHPVRLSGQDCGRGTFSQRHSHIVDQTTEERYTLLNHLGVSQADYEVIDSALSEFAVLGFEYGYTLSAPNALVMWEAQFGDFANGAQVIVDQFISSAEQKWLRMSGLVMLLPHGYEGQGPEHSSARLERYLQQCAEDNMQVANCTTPANYFHLLRRQLKRKFRKPLIVMTPKSLLRHKKCVSTLKDMAGGTTFQPILRDDAELRPEIAEIKLVADADIRRVVMCSGKVYYDLLDARIAKGANDVYLLRVEELYPYPHADVVDVLKRFPKAELVWCQEEPKNMGAWSFIAPWIEESLDAAGHTGKRPSYAGRAASASTATGYGSRHAKELAAFLDAALS
jgi:2-oxoglutarate dehydrogenase E1 component